MNCPADVYTPATRHYRGLPELSYPFHDCTIQVTHCGRICLHRNKINLSTVFAGQAVGIKEVEESIWLVSFVDYDLGYIDLEEKTCSLSTTLSAQKCYLCRRFVLLPMCPGRTGREWRARRDLNPQPLGSKPSALSN